MPIVIGLNGYILSFIWYPLFHCSVTSLKVNPLARSSGAGLIIGEFTSFGFKFTQRSSLVPWLIKPQSCPKDLQRYSEQGKFPSLQSSHLFPPVGACQAEH